MKKMIKLMESDLTRIVKRVIDENKKNKKEMDWKKMGFKSNEDYLKFLDYLHMLVIFYLHLCLQDI